MQVGGGLVSDALTVPDGERAEWINKIISQMWPFIKVFAHDTLKKEIEPLLAEALSSVLDDFTFVTIDLGDLPPRIEEVNVHASPAKPQEISLDLKFKFESNSTFAVNVVVANLGINDFSVKGTLRLMVRPLVDRAPLCGGISICFLNNPEINFNLTGLANVLEGLKDTWIMGRIQKVVMEQLVIPNRVSIPLAKDLDMKDLLFLEPEGVLRLRVVEGRNLKDEDWLGKGDPYTIVTVGAQSFKTKVINNNQNPKWDQEFEFIVDEREGQCVTLQVMDADTVDSDDVIGSASLEISSVYAHNDINKTVPLWLEGKERGELHLEASCYRLSADPKDLGVLPAFPYSAVLVVFIGSAELLKAAGRCIARASVGDTTHETKGSNSAESPTWNKSFRFLLNDPKNHTLNIQILNKDNQKAVLGETSLPLMYLLKADFLQMDSKLPFAGNKGSVRVAAMLRVLTMP